MLCHAFLPILSLLALVPQAHSIDEPNHKGDKAHILRKVDLSTLPAADTPSRPDITPAVISNTANSVRRAEGADNEVPPLEFCRFSCPTDDSNGLPLAHKATAFGWDFDGFSVSKGKGSTRGKGWYDIFECVYSTPALITNEHTCSYYKNDGTHALGYPGDNCPEQAPACLLALVPPPALSTENSVTENVGDSAEMDNNGQPQGVQSSNTDDDEDEDYSDNGGTSTPGINIHPSTTPTIPLFSSSQLDGAISIDATIGIYSYANTPNAPPWWVEDGRHLLWLKEHPPATLD